MWKLGFSSGVVSLLILVVVVGCEKWERKPSTKASPIATTPSPAPEASSVRRVGVMKAPIHKLTVGENHSCVLDAGGKVRCWGSNAHGQLGQDPAKLKLSSVPVSPDFDQAFSDITAGRFLTCGITLDVDRKVMCWGTNESSVLGLNGKELVFSFRPIAIDKMVPMPVGSAVNTVNEFAKSLNLPAPFASEVEKTELKPMPLNKALRLYSRFGRVCAVTDEEVLCWGAAHYVWEKPKAAAKPEILDGKPTGVVPPTPGPDFTREFITLREKDMKTPVSLNTSELEKEVWGPPWTTKNLDIDSLVLLENDTCALVRGQVRCLNAPAGDTGFTGLAGNRKTLFMLTRGMKAWSYAEVKPKTALSVEVGAEEKAEVTALAAGATNYYCLATAQGAIDCVGGKNDQGQLGFVGAIKGEVNHEVKVYETSLIAAGEDHACATNQKNEIWCWGNNTYGQCGGTKAEDQGVDPIDPEAEWTD